MDPLHRLQGQIVSESPEEAKHINTKFSGDHPHSPGEPFTEGVDGGRQRGSLRGEPAPQGCHLMGLSRQKGLAWSFHDCGHLMWLSLS